MMRLRNQQDRAFAQPAFTVPDAVQVEAFHLVFASVLPSAEAENRLSQLLEPSDASQLAQLVDRDVRSKTRLPESITLAVIGRLYHAERLSDDDWYLSDELGRMVGRVYLANSDVQVVRALGIGSESQAAIKKLEVEPVPDKDKAYPILGYYLLPVYLTGQEAALDAFMDRLLESKAPVGKASSRTIAWIAQCFAVDAANLSVFGYVPEAMLEDTLAELYRAGQFGIATRKIVEGETDRTGYGTAMLFTEPGRAVVPFFTFDKFAEANLELTPDDLPDAYLAWLADYRTLLDNLEQSKVPVTVIEGSRAMLGENEQVAAHARTAAKEVTGLLMEVSDHEVYDGPFDPSEVASVNITFCDTKAEKGVYAVLSKQDAEGRLLSQLNLYPVVPDGMKLAMEYAKGEAGSFGVQLSSGVYDDIEFCEVHRKITAPIISSVSPDADLSDALSVRKTRTVH
jgi:hypothetical protein